MFAVMRERHGMRSTPTYGSWLKMRQRCYDPKNNRYAYYGGRGVTVHPAWRDSFSAFFADVGERPPGTSLDRFPNKDGNYEPGNVRWATPEQQARNQTKTVFEPHEPAQIRWLVNDLGYTQVEVARFFGVGKSHINQIVHNQIWQEG